MSDLRQARIQNERKVWRQDPDRPAGMSFAPSPPVGDQPPDISKWVAKIPGPAGSPWEGGLYTLNITFPPDYPNAPPKCQFSPVIWHPNVYPSGTVCLSILNEDLEWRSSITIKTILMAIQWLLANPNILSPAQEEPFRVLKADPERYERRVREEAAKYRVI